MYILQMANFNKPQSCQSILLPEILLDIKSLQLLTIPWEPQEVCVLNPTGISQQASAVPPR